MKRHLFLILLSVLASAAAMAEQHYVINVGDFDHLRVTDNLNVTYRCLPDSAGLAVFDASEDELHALLFTNKKERLTVQVSTDIAIADDTMPHVVVYSSSIKEIENMADSTIWVDGLSSEQKVKLLLTDNGRIIARRINAPEVEAKIFTGKGLIEVSGWCDLAKLNCTGTGEIRAQELEARKVECKIVGTGHLRCWVNGGQLVTKGSGPGRVYYRGTPSEIKSYHLGKMKVIPM